MKKKVQEIGGDVPTNGAQNIFFQQVPYIVEVEIQGIADLLFHRWNCEGVAEKAKATKGSRTKKTDDIETYVFRDSEGNIALPGMYFVRSIVEAAKYQQDPRSPRKSAMELFKAGIISLTNYASLGKSAWDYEDKRRVVVQRNGINRTRPAMKAGWKATFQLEILIPEYISEEKLHDAISMAGRLVGVGDFRPTYGRFQIVTFKK